MESSIAVLILAVAWCIGVVIQAALLWISMRIVLAKTPFLILLLASFISSVFSFIPTVGALIGAIVLIVLLVKWTDIGSWQGALLVVLICSGLTMFLTAMLTPLFA